MINRRRLGVFLKIVISVALVWVLLSAFGGEDALKRLIDVHPGWLLVAIGLGVVQVIIGGLRWRAVMVAIDTPMASALVFRFTYIGAFFNQTLPSAAGGDAVRTYLAYKSGLKLGPAVNGMVLDRVATVLALVVLVAMMMPFAADGLVGGDWFARSVWVVLAVALGGTAVIMFLDRLPATLQRFRIVAGAGLLANDARRVFLRPFHSTTVMAWALLGHVNLSVLAFVLARGLSVDVTVMDCLLLFPPVLLAQTLPISVAGWGVREGAMVSLFALVGVSGESALAISILYGIVLALISLPGAAFWLASGTRTLQEAEAFSQR